MIKSISAVKSNGFGNINMPKETQPIKRNIAGEYADSFVRHAAESTPMLLALTTTWAVLDKTQRNIPFKNALKHNMKNYFAPVLLVSSAVLAAVENKKPKNNA